MKRTISSLLAAIMLLALASPALAAAEPDALPVQTAANDAPRTAAALPSEQEVYERLIAMQEVYPQWSPWDSSSYYIDKNGYAEYGCFGFAIMLQEAAFPGISGPRAKKPPITIEDLHVGDVLSYGGISGHSVIVLEVHSDYIVLAEGNWSDSVNWGRTMSAEEVQNAHNCYTYYPDRVVTTRNGWKYEDDQWYYYKNDVRLTGWVQDGGSVYYCDPEADGAMVKGLFSVDGQTYYFSEKTDGSGGVMRTGWVWLEDTYYYFAPATGAMLISGWVYDGGRQYYQGPDGRQVSGWQQFGNELFFLNDRRDGTFGAVVSGWRQIGDDWYYFHPLHDGHFGALRTGWVQDGGLTYYCDPETGIMLSGWQTIDGQEYYFSQAHDGSFGVLRS